MQQKEPPDKSKQTFWGEAFSAVSLGWELAVPIFGGVLLGHALDKWLATGMVFTLGLLGLGVFAGFYSLWSFNKRFEAKQRQSENNERKGKDS